MRAIIFDLFETLVTEWGRPKYTTREIAANLDIDYSDFRREWEVLHSDRYLGKLSGTSLVYKTILKKLGVERDESLLLEITRERDECKRRCFEHIEQDIIELLSSLKKEGYKIDLISNCSSEETEALPECELYGYFDVVVLSCDVGMVKPDISIYEHCLNLLGEKAGNCYYVGDGGSDELRGAERAGMKPLRALWFIKHFVRDYDADRTYPAFSEPRELLNYVLEQ